MGVNERLATPGNGAAWYRPLRCPNPGCDGEPRRFQLIRYEGIWVRLRCPECGNDFKVKSGDGRHGGIHVR